MSTSIPSEIARRLNYHNGMFLTAENMTVEQNYFSNWIRLQNRCLYTPGVLSGLAVTEDSSHMWWVAPGTAINANGDFLIFPGTSPGTLLTPATIPGDSYNLYVMYPPDVTGSPDVVNQAAVLKNGPLSTSELDASVLLAEVFLTDGRITKIENRRAPVESLLPAKLNRGGTLHASVETSLNAALQGSVIVDTRTLLKPGDSVSLPVFYLADKSLAFNAPPKVHATVLGPTPYAINVDHVSSSQCTLTLSAVQTRTDDTLSTQVNWLAMPDSLTIKKPDRTTP
ncbi:hypothetical protein [Paraherbaspirillum soli]|uniref:Uncharacterized protein n=1 Tax=Paraherbaspirillum soli TaxID=631222 RepID=A0ABW0MCL3_9BURK